MRKTAEVVYKANGLLGIYDDDKLNWRVRLISENYLSQSDIDGRSEGCRPFPTAGGKILERI